MARAPGTMVTDKVRLVKRIGEGAMGEVWVGFHEMLQVEVAVKFLSDELESGHADSAERFGVEAAAAAKIKSAHVVRTFDHGQTEDGTLYIVMELLEGLTLQERLEQSGPLSVSDTYEVLRQIGKALDAAHAAGIVHRDVKPHNIFMMNQQGELFIKLLDFGSAMITGQKRNARLTLPGMLIGTPEYISRDLITNPRTVTHRTDLWALGVVAYKCLAGEVPFQGNAINEICEAIANGKFRRPSRTREDLTARHDEWFMRVFNHDPSERPGTGAEMAHTFLTSARVERRSRAGRLLTRERLSLVALGVSALLAGAAIYLTQRNREPEPVAAAPTPPPSAPAPTASSPAPSATIDLDEVAIDASTIPTAPPENKGIAPKGLVSALAAARVVIPRGRFWMGCAADKDPDCRPDERPGHFAELDEYAIDRVEVSVALYTHCASAGVCTGDKLHGFQLEDGPFTASDKCNWGRPERRQHPINCVTWDEALAFCQWIGARLPTEAEWEKAARGVDKRRFPWSGDFANCQLAVMGEGADGCRAGGTWPVGTKRAGASPYGVYNMAGNVSEWTADWYGERSYSTPALKNPTGPDKGDKRGARGGSWGNVVARFLRTTAREGLVPSTRSVHLGFRCASGG